ncbi:MAG: membrane lipoprotein lipid attachment site-containing protein [Candidatus Moranbacteria bacterium]|nr:membrane lipoprotein lipid attachment site-containing protein [Candidatus Moranbacteria bacterium]
MKKIFLGLGLLVILSGCGEQVKIENKNIEENKVEEKKDESKKEQVNEMKEDDQDLIIDVNKIVGKSFEEVKEIIGSSEKMEKVKISNYDSCVNSCEKHFFQSEKYEIVFIKNQATIITITPEKKLPLNENSIELLGFSKRKPDFKNNNFVFKWKSLKNIEEISFFDDGSGKIDYIYIINN